MLGGGRARRGTTRSPRRRGALAVFALGVTVAAACTSPPPIDPERAEGARTLVTLLALLEVADEPPRVGYDRALFAHWNDINGSGCTARQDALVAQALGLVQRDVVRPCVIVEGDWHSLFDGVAMSGASSEADVDHVVALAEAWDSGADAWSFERREQFANDPLHLLVVTRRSNQDKADLDAGEWKPPRRDAWCVTASMIVLTKLRYALTVDPAERDGLQTMALSCERADQRTVPGVPLPGTLEFDATALAVLEERGLGSDAVLGDDVASTVPIVGEPASDDEPTDPSGS